MASDYGKQMALAMRAIIDMHGNCVRLFHDLDKEFPEYRALHGKTVALDLGASISRRRYLAESLIRLYCRGEAEDKVLGINICFFDQNNDLFEEPLLVVANTRYSQDEALQKKVWDPWDAFLHWAPKRVYQERITLEHPVKHSSIESITVAAMPLAGVANLAAALALIELTGRP